MFFGINKSFDAISSGIPTTYVFEKKSHVDRDVPTISDIKKNRYALIIGNEDYSSRQPGLSSESNVEYARNDASAFREYAINTFGVPKERIITYPSLNPDIPFDKRKDLVEKPYEHDGPIELLCISALRPYKGVDYLLQSMKIVQEADPTIRLTIIGEGGMRGELETYMKENGITNTTLRGFVEDYHDVLKMMAGCDMLVLSSASDEGNPRVILESFQFSRPVIATAAGGTPELIEDGKNGLLPPPKDPQRFAEDILRLSKDPKLREKLGRNGKKFLDRLPTWDDLAKDINDVYQDIWSRM